MALSTKRMKCKKCERVVKGARGLGGHMAYNHGGLKANGHSTATRRKMSEAAKANVATNGKLDENDMREHGIGFLTRKREALMHQIDQIDQAMLTLHNFAESLEHLK